jgi:hypothetical protein
MDGDVSRGRSNAHRCRRNVNALGRERSPRRGLHPGSEGQSDQGAEGVRAHHADKADGLLPNAQEHEGAEGVRQASEARCEVRQSPPPPPPPPQPPPTPPPTTPGAAATYAFGPEVTATQQAVVRNAFDLAARYFRSTLGRELPPVSVWAHTDAEAMVRTFAQTRPNTTLDQARDLWIGRGQVMHAENRRIWIGPLWFATPSADGAKIVAKEAFMVLLYAAAGENSLNSGLDDIPRAGPRWVSEGTGELAGHLAVAAAGLMDMPSVRARWAGAAAASATPLRALAVLRGQYETANAFAIFAFAADRLVGDAGVTKLLTYFDAIGRGVSWPEAFTATFGKSVDAYYAEFEANRR